MSGKESRDRDSRSDARTVVAKKTLVATALAALGAMGSAHAFQVVTDNPDLRINFDNTIRYNLGWRMQSPDPRIANPAKYPGAAFSAIGDAQYDKHDLITHRLDWLSELDVVYKENFGFRVSAAAWYDDAFDSLIKNPYGTTSQKHFGSDAKRFTGGPSAEILDAFVFANGQVGGTGLSIKAGQFALVWGEAQFSAANSIGHGQSPADVRKQTISPGASPKETALPTGQVVLQIQPTPELQFNTYYQYKWKADRFTAGGTFFGIADPLFDNGLPLFGGSIQPAKSRDGDDGDWGIQMKWTPLWLDGTLGISYREYAAKAPQILFDDMFMPESAYQNDIEMWGITLNKRLGGWSTSVELSQRRNMPLLAQFYAPTAINVPGFYQGSADGPRGTTTHFLINGIALFYNTWFDSGAVVLEFSYQHLNKVTKNPDMFKAKGYTGNITNNLGWFSATSCETGDDVVFGCASKNSYSMAAFFEPTWYQVLPGWDFSVPMFFSRDLHGNAATGTSNEGFTVYNIGGRMLFRTKHRFTLSTTWYDAKQQPGNGGYNAGAPYKDKATLNFTYDYTF